MDYVIKYRNSREFKIIYYKALSTDEENSKFICDKVLLLCRKFKVHMLQSSVIKQKIQSSYDTKFCYYVENSKFICYKVLLLSRKFKIHMIQNSATKQKIQSSYVIKFCR